jgi:hypothetical protein
MLNVFSHGHWNMLHTYVGNNLCMLSRTWIWEQELKCFNEKDHGHVGGFGNNETIMITYVDLGMRLTCITKKRSWYLWLIKLCHIQKCKIKRFYYTQQITHASIISKKEFLYLNFLMYPTICIQTLLMYPTFQNLKLINKYKYISHIIS